MKEPLKKELEKVPDKKKALADLVGGLYQPIKAAGEFQVIEFHAPEQTYTFQCYRLPLDANLNAHGPRSIVVHEGDGNVTVTYRPYEQLHTQVVVSGRNGRDPEVWDLSIELDPACGDEETKVTGNWEDYCHDFAALSDAEKKEKKISRQATREEWELLADRADKRLTREEALQLIRELLELVRDPDLPRRGTGPIKLR